MNGGDLCNESLARNVALAAITSLSVGDVMLHSSLTISNTTGFHYRKRVLRRRRQWCWQCCTAAQQSWALSWAPSAPD